MTNTSARQGHLYASLEPYLMCVFQLLEGIADLGEAEKGIRKVIGTPERQGLDPNLEELLYELYFAKCRKYFLRSAK